MLELKRTIFEIKRSFLDELHSILDTGNKMTNDCEDSLFEIIQSKGQREKNLKTWVVLIHFGAISNS